MHTNSLLSMALAAIAQHPAWTKPINLSAHHYPIHRAGHSGVPAARRAAKKRRRSRC